MASVEVTGTSSTGCELTAIEAQSMKWSSVLFCEEKIELTPISRRHQFHGFDVFARDTEVVKRFTAAKVNALRKAFRDASA